MKTVTRIVNGLSLVRCDSVSYLVPRPWIGRSVYVERDGKEVCIWPVDAPTQRLRLPAGRDGRFVARQLSDAHRAREGAAA